MEPFQWDSSHFFLRTWSVFVFLRWIGRSRLGCLLHRLRSHVGDWAWNRGVGRIANSGATVNKTDQIWNASPVCSTNTMQSTRPSSNKTMKLDPLLPVFITKRLIESNLYRYFFRHPKWHFFFSAQALFLFRFGFFFFLNGSLCPATDRLEWGRGGGWVVGVHSTPSFSGY